MSLPIRLALLGVALSQLAGADPAHILTSEELGEVTYASYTGDLSKAEQFRLEAGGFPLGHFVDANWISDFQTSKKFLKPTGQASLCSARPSAAGPGHLTLRNKSGKTFGFDVPGLMGGTEGKRYTLPSGTAVPNGHLYLGSDGHVYLDKDAQNLAR